MEAVTFGWRFFKTRMAFQTDGTEKQIPRGKHSKPGTFEAGVRSGETRPARGKHRHGGVGSKQGSVCS